MIPDDVVINSNNSLTVLFGSPVSGTSVVMYGDITGAQKPAYQFTHIQTELSSSWVVNHALGYYPIVRVFIGTSEVQPMSIVHNTINQTTITFSQSYVGQAVFA